MRQKSWLTHLGMGAVLTTGAALCMLTLTHPSLAQQSGLTKDDLRNRVQDFYQTLQKKQFGRAWDLFLAPGIKSNTPREEYIGILDTSLGAEGVLVTVASDRGEVWITKTGTGDRERPLGMAVTPILVKFREGTTVTADHTTMWISDPKRSSWFLVRDEMKEKSVK